MSLPWPLTSLGRNWRKRSRMKNTGLIEEEGEAAFLLLRRNMAFRTDDFPLIADWSILSAGVCTQHFLGVRSVFIAFLFND